MKTVLLVNPILMSVIKVFQFILSVILMFIANKYHYFMTGLIGIMLCSILDSRIRFIVGCLGIYIFLQQHELLPHVYTKNINNRYGYVVNNKTIYLELDTNKRNSIPDQRIFNLYLTKNSKHPSATLECTHDCMDFYYLTTNSNTDYGIYNTTIKTAIKEMLENRPQEPSTFICSKAITFTEKHICSTAQWKAKDRTMQNQYYWVIKWLSEANEDTSEVKAHHSQWLKSRNQCLTELCVFTTFRQESQYLAQIQIDFQKSNPAIISAS